MKKIKFARFGGLSSVNQLGYDSKDDGYHAPPSKRGFYAFVWPYYEFFLLGGGEWTSHAWSIGTKFSYVKDGKGNIVTDKHPDYEHLYTSEKNWSIPTKEWHMYQLKYPDYEDPLYDEKVDAINAEWEANKPRWVLVKKPSPKIFEYKGNLWHHLEDHIGPSGVLKRKGGWVLSPFDEYAKALEKDMHAAVKLQMCEWSGNKLPMSTKNPYRGVCKDHLEVFIEKL
jgi:hypothetical protein